MELVWQREEETCTLDEEAVLCWEMELPRVEENGRAGQRMNRFYARVAELWKKRWRKDLYHRACQELVCCRAASRPFTPWTARLKGECLAGEEGPLHLRITGEERRGNEDACRVSWEDVWDSAGYPIFPRKKKRRKISP